MAKVSGVEVIIDGCKVGVIESFQPSDRRIEPVHALDLTQSFCAGKTTFPMLLCGRRSGKVFAMGVAVQYLKSQAFRELGGMGDKQLKRR